jgi:predicted CoA-binding protein
MSPQAVLQRYGKIAVIGISPNAERPSHYVSLHMQESGYEITGVNPGQSTVLGRPCYASLKEVPGPLEIVAVFRSSEYLAGIVRECLELEHRPQVLWIQLGIEDAAAEALAEKSGMIVIRRRCLMVEQRLLKEPRVSE